MVATEVINATDGDLLLKEGNAGVYRLITALGPGKMYKINLDRNATCPEYVVMSTPGGDKVFVTSDDCIDNSKITILKKDGKYSFEGDPRGDADPSSGGFFAQFWNKVSNKI